MEWRPNSGFNLAKSEKIYHHLPLQSHLPFLTNTDKNTITISCLALSQILFWENNLISVQNYSKWRQSMPGNNCSLPCFTVFICFLLCTHVRACACLIQSKVLLNQFVSMVAAHCNSLYIFSDFALTGCTTQNILFTSWLWWKKYYCIVSFVMNFQSFLLLFKLFQTAQLL